MNPRKRRADEPLLPLRMPKQPRTTLLGHNGENPSPSQHEGILSRWISLAREAWVLGRLSVLHIVGGQSCHLSFSVNGFNFLGPSGPSGDYPFQSSTVSIPQIPQTHTPLPLDYALHPPLSGPLHPPALARKKSLSVLPPTLQRKQSISKLPPPAPAPKTPSTTIPPSPNNFLQSSAPSALASSSHRTPSRTRYDSHPELESALAAASPQASRRRYYNRPHIHEKLAGLQKCLASLHAHNRHSTKKQSCPRGKRHERRCSTSCTSIDAQLVCPLVHFTQTQLISFQDTPEISLHSKVRRVSFGSRHLCLRFGAQTSWPTEQN